jgi:type I restriction enzyme, S subunit
MRWKEVKINSFADIVTGGTPSTQVDDYWQKGTIPWLNSGDLNMGEIDYSSNFITELGLKNSSTKMMPPNTVLIALTGATTGVTAILNISACANQSVTGILPSEKHCSQFLYYYLKSQREKILRKTWGGAQPHINQKYIKDFLVPLPPISDQFHIANILTKAENLISKRKESIRLLDEFLKSTFLEMFYSNPEAENWDETRFEELADKKKGSMRTGPFGSSLLHGEFTEVGDVKVLGIDNIVTNRFDWKRSRCITNEKYQELKRYRVFPNDVLISIMATLGRTAVVPKDIPLSINSKHLAAITLDNEIANPYFVAYAFHSHPLIVRQLTKSVKGAIMDGLNLTIIRRIKLKLPPIGLQNKFGETFNRTEALKTQYQQSLHELENLYGSLSQKAFRGELSIKED